MIVFVVVIERIMLYCVVLRLSMFCVKRICIVIVSIVRKLVYFSMIVNCSNM